MATRRPERQHSLGQHKGWEKYVLDDNGNPTVLTAEIRKKLVAETRKGRWPQMAAIRAGVDPRTLLSWLEKGVDEVAIEPYKSFAIEFLQAEADFCAELEEVLYKRATGQMDYEPGKPRPDAEVARYLLERRMRVLWGGQALSALEVVSNAGNKRLVKQKALEFLEGLSETDRRRARDKGIMLPDSTGKALPKG